MLEAWDFQGRLAALGYQALAAGVRPHHWRQQSSYCQHLNALDPEQDSQGLCREARGCQGSSWPQS